MALIAIASDKGAPGVTTAALALAAVWPRPVLLAECDQAGGDLVYRFPAVGGGHLDPRRGVLSLAVVARRGMQPQQVWEHVQKLHGGLDVLAGVTNAEQGAGLSLLWGPIGRALAALPQADVIADCGRLGADGPLYDLLIEATAVVLVSKVHVADVIRLRDRASAFAAAAHNRGRRGFGVGVVVVAEHKKFRAALGEVQHVLGQANAPATVLGGIAHDTKGADLLSGEWGGNLDRTMLIKTAREVAQQLVQGLPPIGDPAAAPPGYPAQAPPGYPAQAAPGDRAVASSGYPAQAAPGYPAGAYAGQPAPAGHAMTPPAPPAPPAAPAGRRHAAMPAPPPAAAPPAAAFSGSQGLMPPGPWQGSPEPAPHLAAVTLSAPTVSADAPRTTFSRVLGGRGGRHQADPTQVNPAQVNPAQASGGPDQSEVPAAASPPATERSAAYSVTPTGPAQTGAAQTGAAQTGAAQTGAAQPRPARHAAPAGGGPGGGPAFSRTPMPPLTPPVGQAEPGDQENAEDPGWGAAPWRRQAGPSWPGGE